MSIDKAKDPTTLRNAAKGDEGFIFVTWLKGLRYGNDVFRLIDKNAYFENYRKVIEAILNRPNVSVIVCCLREDPDVILGYAVVEGETLHWVFVKRAWRRFKIARELVPPNITRATHITTIGQRILERTPEMKFNPFI